MRRWSAGRPLSRPVTGSTACRLQRPSDGARSRGRGGIRGAPRVCEVASEAYLLARPLAARSACPTREMRGPDTPGDPWAYVRATDASEMEGSLGCRGDRKGYACETRIAGNAHRQSPQHREKRLRTSGAERANS